MHLTSVTHINDGSSYKKIIEKWIEEAVTHSNTKQCGEMKMQRGCRPVSTQNMEQFPFAIHFVTIIFIQSLLVCTTQSFSSRIYSDLLLYLITGLLGVCIMVV